MADPGMSVTPYWELTFDADGDVDGGQRDRLLGGVGKRGVADLVVFAHGWNSDRSGATGLYSRFFAPFPALAPQARLGYVGVLWPSMRFSDEPIPDFKPVPAVAPSRLALDKNTRHGLLEVFPGRAVVVEQLARLLEQRPDDGPALEEFGRLVRLLVEVEPQGPQGAFTADTLTAGVPEGTPGMLCGDAVTVCTDFAAALAEVGTTEVPTGAAVTPPQAWDGAHELLRQATYFAMKRRAGTVGERGLGRLLGQLAERAPKVRVHLVGHSFGARLVSFALRGLPEGVRTVKSVTLLQAAFSHYAFAARLPHDSRASGVLNGQQKRIDGPLVCCHSKHDSALGTIYPLASRMAGDARTVLGLSVNSLLGAKWGALGYSGVQAVRGTRSFKLADALKAQLPTAGCVNVDASAVVKRGGAPSGAHSDICHRELARVVLAAGRIV
ncbi:serine-threonine protein kinase [Streptomyces griseiscabiei]|uniref:Serine-threonine protein kinase n=1 Tax=Streptomyces griseiscabiei TaxID=2993540 RepID=A0ABU4LET9_9ACTN|nr:serine-threonine protein kinase [Streptomyces griseiscabiei]MBZ3902633.1 serine-threonine protein kinase [Streptomyces griseiscabiei]MDX2914178.1 serine-threonine protein kinase [Streptomyces griseiscabiei]